MYKVKVENLMQLDIAISSNVVSEIILARDSFNEKDLPLYVDKIKANGKKTWIMLERISRFEEDMKSISKINNAANNKTKNQKHLKEMDFRISTDKLYDISNLDGIIVQNLDSFAYMLRKINKTANDKLMVELNYTMNCYNSETKKLYENLYNTKRNNASKVPLLFTAPVELNIYELKDVGYDTMLLYSYIDTMVSANCLRKNTMTKINDIQSNKILNKVQNTNIVAKHTEDTLCKHRFDFNNVADYASYIIDRKGKRLYFKTYCKYCYNKIFNTEPLFLLDKTNDIIKQNINKNNSVSFRIDFSFESEKDVLNILKGKCPESFTRGHFKNSIK